MMASGLWIKKLKHEMLNVFYTVTVLRIIQGQGSLTGFSFLKTLASWNIGKVKVKHIINSQNNYK